MQKSPTNRERFRAAFRWIREAGKKLYDYYQHQVTGPIRYKRLREDPVTKVDITIEKYLCERILEWDPGSQILTEESGLLGPPRSDGRWVLDPLDGTVNFIHGIPHFCIALAYEYRGRLIFSMVYHPTRREFFWAIRRRGAYLNGKPIRVSSVQRLNEAVIGTGFNVSMLERIDPALKIFKAFLLTTMGVRRSGSAALDLCYLAAGRLDGFYEESLSPWDTAAGILIVEEAGGRWTDFRGQPTTIYEKELMASNGLLHDQMRETIAWGLQFDDRSASSS